MPPVGRIRWGVAAVVVAVSLLVPGHAAAGRPSVAALQAALKAHGLYGAEVDGVRGPVTATAVRRFQRRRGLTVDGVAGPQTRRALGRRGRPFLGARTLAQGRVGWDVAALQFLLWRRQFAPGAVDGDFGPGTGRAVLAYQRSARLIADAVAGPATIRSLRRGSGPTNVAQPTSPVRFFRPVPGRIGDGFGFVGGRRHTGLDFPVASGTSVRAAGRGVVEFAGRNTGGYGNLIVIRHRLGFSTWYAHLSRIITGPGQPVSGSTTIGYVGSTGRSTGPHLHFEARRFGTPIDPVRYLLTGTAAMATSAGAQSAARPAHGTECGPPSHGIGEAVPPHGPRRYSRARLAGC